MILKQFRELRTADAVQLFGVQKALLGIVLNVGFFYIHGYPYRMRL